MGKVKKPRRYVILNGLLKNDLEYVDAITLREKIHDQSRFSILYFSLLTTSVLVCTLGLLMNSTAIVIGGMLIAPLMWPLARVGFGVAHRLPHHLYRGFLLVLASIVIGTLSAYLITTISPIKVMNEEILARTAPTLMDLFVALAAGLVAAIAITQKKIADSLAGVAIAVSLMPPLCAVGISLSLGSYTNSLGALLLFAVNAACITLVTTIVFILTQYARKDRIRVATRAMAINLLFVFLLSIPLVQFLRTYSFELQSYSSAVQIMDDYIKNIDSAATFENVRVSQADRDTIAVNADLLIPSDLIFSYEENEALVERLERRIGKKVLLNLRIQNVIEPISKNQREDEVMINQISQSFSRELQSLDSSYRINTINISKNDLGGWTVGADILSSPDTAPTGSTITDMSDILSEETGQKIELNLTFVPRLTLRTSQQTLNEGARRSVEQITGQIDTNATVASFNVVEGTEQDRITYTITTNSVESFGELYLQQIRDELASIFDDRPLQLQVRLLQATDITL